MGTGCSGCHNGVAIGGGTFRKFGVAEDAGASQRRHDALYFHDGSVKTLPEAVRIMAKVQLGKDTALWAIVIFLRSLTGKVPKNFATAPVLPTGGFAPASGIGTARLTK
jgi:cytochrome c peroxidase